MLKYKFIKELTEKYKIIPGKNFYENWSIVDLNSVFI